MVFSLRLTQCYCGQIALLAACHRNCKIIVVNVHSSIDNNGGTNPGSLWLFMEKFQNMQGFTGEISHFKEKKRNGFSLLSGKRVTYSYFAF